jgi:tryptophan halogenase
MSGGPRHVVIVGRDAGLWLTASVLRQALGPCGIDVTAIELPTRLGPTSVHATLPAIESLHSRLGIDEAALLRTTGGSFTLGYNIVTPGRPPFFLAHGTYGAPIDGSDFFPFWLKARRFGLGASLEDFSPTAMAARHGRVLLPDEDTETFGRTDYAYHLPALAYAGLLKGHAQRAGVSIHQAMAVTVEVDGTIIRSVRPDDQGAIIGDLYVDASGPDAVLVGAGLGVTTEDWSEFFPFDRLLTGRGERFASVPAYAELRLSADGGAAVLYATQAAASVAYAYRRDLESDEAAMASVARASGLALTKIEIAPIGPSIRAEAWSGNCVAIGSSAGVFDPMIDVDLHAVQLGIVHLLSLFPTGEAAAVEQGEYNRVTRSLFERLRDFQAASYFQAPVPQRPATLQHKINAYETRGTIAPMEDETFTSDQWRALFAGLGLEPQSWPPAIDLTSPDRMKNAFRRILGFVSEKVKQQPTHDAYLADIGAIIAS